MNKQRLPELVSQLYSIVGELEEMFPGRHFTLDGHIIGSLGECLEANYYGLELLAASSEGRDAEKDGISIEIKATQGNRVALRSCPEHLLVLKLDRKGLFVEIYNGPGKQVWSAIADRPRPKNGQYQISLGTLQRLMKSVPDKARIKARQPVDYSSLE